MATFFIYRVNGGEVLTVSVNSQSGFSSKFAQIQDPSTPDGIDLGTRKIRDGSTVRNATQAEIDNFPVAQAADELDEKRTFYNSLLDLGEIRGVALKAIASVVIDELNVIRQWVMSFKTEVAAATNLADLKTRVAALPNLNDRTAAQARTAVKNAITSGAND